MADNRAPWNFLVLCPPYSTMRWRCLSNPPGLHYSGQTPLAEPVRCQGICQYGFSTYRSGGTSPCSPFVPSCRHQLLPYCFPPLPSCSVLSLFAKTLPLDCSFAIIPFNSSICACKDSICKSFSSFCIISVIL